MKRLRTILLLLLQWVLICTACIHTAKAQPYYFKHYQVENGLSNSTVNCSVQDKNGFIWFGTKDGLNRFDGYRFRLFNTEENERSLYPDFIFSLFCDAGGVLWCGCQKGLYRFDAQKEQLVRFLDTLTDVSAIQSDKNGQLWLISRQRACRYNFASNQLTVFPTATYFSATALCMSEDGNIWFSTDDGLLEKFGPASDSFRAFNVFSHSPIPASRWIQKIKPAGASSIYIGTTSQGLKQFDIAQETYEDVLTYNTDKTTIFVRDILNNGNNEFWIATESGIFILQGNTGKVINLKKKFLDPYSLSDNAVYTLCRDTEGCVWAGTYFGGVNYYRKQYANFQKYFPDNTGAAISGNDVREICEDGYGNLWIGTEDAGLNKLNKATGAITHFEPTGEKTSISYTNIHGLLVAGNNLWIGTFEHGLDIMDIRTGKVKKHYTAGTGKNDMKSNFTLCLLQHSSGNIFVGSSNGLYRYDSTADNFTVPATLPPHLFISSLIEAHDHIIWVGTHSNGAFWFNPATRATGHISNEPDNKNSLTNNDINAIYEDSFHNIWFSTEGGGLCKLDGSRKTVSRFTVKNGLPANFIFKVLEDNKKHLWVTTSKGLADFDPVAGTFAVYTRANGLLNDQFNYHSGYKDAQGTLYFGSVKGMISFNPATFSQSNFTPPIYITGFQVNNKELEVGKDSAVLQQSIMYTSRLTLPYNRSSFSIDFAALSYTSPEMTHYSYIMEGLDKEWTYLNANRKVYFTNLAPGTYTFKVGVTRPNHPPRSVTQLVIRITPPFWATYYAYLLYAIAFAGLCYYIVRSYHKRIENKKEKEIYEAKINFFTIVAHEIRTPLTLIKGPVENLHEKIAALPEIKEDVITMERNTSRLVALITQILDFRQTETKGFSIDFTKADVNGIVREEYLDFMPVAKKKNLSYTADLPADPVFAMADEEALRKIFSNLFSNAVKYAGTLVHVRLLPPVKEDGYISIEISNDGFLIPGEMNEKIFEPFYRLKETIKQKGTGIGLALARSLAELHNGNLYLKAERDAVNTFVLRLPLRPPETQQRKQKQKKLLLTTNK